jgi:hypothetical protein
MIKKYEFASQAQAYSELQATPNGRGFLRVQGAENAVDLGHIVLFPGVYVDDHEITPAVLSIGYCVDVMWTQTPPAHLAQFEVNPSNPKHHFA